jgi:peptide/nickel transport system permease protein
LIKSFLLRKFIIVLITIYLVATTVFFLLRMNPGGPATALLGDYAPREAIVKLQRELGLDKSIFEQYTVFIAKLIKGDLDKSYVYKMDVIELVLKNLPHTLFVLLGCMILGIPGGLILGMIAAMKKDSPIDTGFRIFSLTWISTPGFVVGTGLILLFSVRLRWIPIGTISKISDIWPTFVAAILPSVTLGLFLMGYLSRLTRTCFVEILVEDYIRTAKSMGIPKTLIIFKYGLRNGLISISTVLGVYMIGVIGSSPVVEMVFARPGLGSLLVRAMQQSDFPVIQGTIICFSFLVMVINFSIDILYGLIDPRVKGHA